MVQRQNQTRKFLWMRDMERELYAENTDSEGKSKWEVNFNASLCPSWPKGKQRENPKDKRWLSVSREYLHCLQGRRTVVRHWPESLQHSPRKPHCLIRGGSYSSIRCPCRDRTSPKDPGCHPEMASGLWLVWTLSGHLLALVKGGQVFWVTRAQLTYCWGLNVHQAPWFMCWSPKLQYHTIRRWVLREVLRVRGGHAGGAFMTGFMSL